jgi:hypothetical protein
VFTGKRKQETRKLSFKIGGNWVGNWRKLPPRVSCLEETKQEIGGN